jgi:CubicO group peptidase (beta-lactamase class C family)
MYRWASIAKPLTAVAALQLVERGELDLDRDVRELVPEFPSKAYVFSSRQLLCHQAGIVHYQHMGIRTLRDYEVEHPWADPILRLDMFNERELLFEPGTAYSYTTPGFVLLGAVVERAGEGTYVEQVSARICRPLGMTTMQPDYEWVEIPHRARGYVRDGEGRVVDSGSDDISWKLPAGGWISTVGDLARFGAGLAGDELLELETREAMWTRQTTADGSVTGYGLGIGVGDLGGLRTVSHSGGQKKASTFLLVCPERDAAVAVMCNTEGIRLAQLAHRLMKMVLGA